MRSIVPLLRRVLGRVRRVLAPRDPDAWVQRYPLEESGTKEGLRRLCAALLADTGGTIFGGPFAGMVLPPQSSICHQPNAIIGSYEQEVHDIINEVVCNPPSCVIDIGAAQGLYVVGLARLTAHIPIIAFEMNERLWPVLAQLAEANGVRGRIEQRGACTVESLGTAMREGAFVISDCEGAEVELLDPSAIPALRTALILCELHDFYVPGLTATLVERFRQSHYLEIRCESPRNPENYRILRHTPPAFRPILCDETRHLLDPFRLTSARFIIMRPRATAGRLG